MRYMFLLEKSILMSTSEKNLGCTEGGGMEPAGLTGGCSPALT